MLENERKLLQDVKRLLNKKELLHIAAEIDKSFYEIINDTNGKQVAEVGYAMLGYYLDLFLVDTALGMSATKVLINGYEGYPHTDLYAPYYDSTRTRIAWSTSTEQLDKKDHSNQLILLNTYFRWYVATYELYRKMLIFDCYCLSLNNPKMPINLKNHLFGTSDPAKVLRNSGNTSRKRLVDCYDSTVRHAVAHANIVIIPGSMVVIRSWEPEQFQVIEKIYEEPEAFIQDVGGNIEVMYQSIRFFYSLLFQYLFPRNQEIFVKHIGTFFRNRVLVAMIQDIQKNIAS